MQKNDIFHIIYSDEQGLYKMFRELIRKDEKIIDGRNVLCYD